jgi:hypothetical protein
MKKTIKILFKPILPKALFNFKDRIIEKKQYKIWKENGCPNPPPHIVKQIIISEYQQKYKYETLVETGTYKGDMVAAQKKRFQQIYSIELGTDLFRMAKKRFRKDKNVTILQGDSGNVLPVILKDLKEPAIFWLDGHYSAGLTAKGDKECPIFEELDGIFNNRKFDHVVLIDDARCFNGNGDYPTIEQLSNYIKGKDEKYHIEINNDIIRVTI